MFQWILSGLQALLIVVMVPMVIPSGDGGMLQPWKRLLLDPVKAWKLDYYVDPYRTLFQSGQRLLFTETGPVEVRVIEHRDGSLHASNLPEAEGKPVVLEDRNADLAAPTRFQGNLMMAFCWLLVLLALQWTKWRYWQKEGARPHRKGLAEFIPYKVQSRIVRPIRDITPDEEPRSEQRADNELRKTRVMKALEHETDTERELLG